MTEEQRIYKELEEIELRHKPLEDMLRDLDCYKAMFDTLPGQEPSIEEFREFFPNHEITEEIFNQPRPERNTW